MSGCHQLCPRHLDLAIFSILKDIFYADTWDYNPIFKTSKEALQPSLVYLISSLQLLLGKIQGDFYSLIKIIS